MPCSVYIFFFSRDKIFQRWVISFHSFRFTCRLFRRFALRQREYLFCARSRLAYLPSLSCISIAKRHEQIYRSSQVSAASWYKLPLQLHTATLRNRDHVRITVGLFRQYTIISTPHREIKHQVVATPPAPLLLHIKLSSSR